jgi:olfactory receptor
VTFAIALQLDPKFQWTSYLRKSQFPFFGCAVQFLIFCIFADAECVLLAVMALTRTQPSATPYSTQ